MAFARYRAFLARQREEEKANELAKSERLRAFEEAERQVAEEKTEEKPAEGKASTSHIIEGYKHSLRTAKNDRKKIYRPVIEQEKEFEQTIGQKDILDIITDYDVLVIEKNKKEIPSQARVRLTYMNISHDATFDITPSGDIRCFLVRSFWSSQRRREVLKGIINVDSIQTQPAHSIHRSIMRLWSLDEPLHSWTDHLHSIQQLIPVMICLIKAGDKQAQKAVEQYYDFYEKHNVFKDFPELQDKECANKFFKQCDQTRTASLQKARDTACALQVVANINQLRTGAKRFFGNFFLGSTLDKSRLVDSIKRLSPSAFKQFFDIIYNNDEYRAKISDDLKPIIKKMITNGSLTPSDINPTAPLGKVIDLHKTRSKQEQTPTKTRQFTDNHFAEMYIDFSLM